MAEFPLADTATPRHVRDAVNDVFSSNAGLEGRVTTAEGEIDDAQFDITNLETFKTNTGDDGLGIANKLAETVNVLDHGATGDGTTDDFTALQAALTAVPAGGTVVIPRGASGVYEISDGLTCSTDGVSIISAPGVTIRADASFDTSTDMFLSSGAEDQVVSGLTFDGNSRARWGIRHSLGVNCLIEKNHIFACQVGIRHGSGTNNIIRGNHCYSNTGQGIVEIGATGFPALHNKILDNYCYDNGTDTVGNLGWGINVSEHSRYFIVSGNHCYDNFQGGIVADVLHTGSSLVLQDAEGTISNNVCTGTAGSNGSHGISYQGGIGGSIMGNIITGAPRRGLFLNARGVTFGGNVFGDNTLSDAGMFAGNPTAFTPTVGGFYTWLPNTHLGGSGINGVIQDTLGAGTQTIAAESRVLTLTDGTTPAINAAEGSVWELTILANSNRTILNPTNMVRGKIYMLRIANGTGGAYSATLAFVVNWRQTGAAVPANGKITSAQFIYDGSNITQITPWTGGV